MATEPLDVDVDQPSEPGWYGTIHAWDLEYEGAFGSAHYWDGKAWLDKEGGEKADLPIFRFTQQRFATEEEAHAAGEWLAA
ncbi:hypothetical protein ABID82_007124 [Methylobacterium sp. PvP062]|uniref:Uncharacterized protein n=1 Tax=Methylobacterium radiotolerans TaxID=31998 RepID=A0ABV2NKZ8_9HYPH|nr:MULTISPECIES: hypothetical protein [unclassified Methylobacterium]KZB99795.1 hypothetical protein AU375_04084 [Methylobacterium radiotolerans]MBP2496095.1 hypothetical protein [Methylobacterium sp. PvP105]MBP2504034.1 hypothetical protein [Methylobacterium sp. PvP109]